MATLIDTSYFFQQLTITGNNERLQSFIEELEPKFLEILMGYGFKKLYDAGIEANNQDYKDIRDGKEYLSRTGETLKWQGLKQSFGSTKKSLIANYVYYWFVRDNVSQTTKTGEKYQSEENSVNAGVGIKAFRAWNEMVDSCWAFRDFMLSNIDKYGAWKDPVNMVISIYNQPFAKERRNLFSKIGLI